MEKGITLLRSLDQRDTQVVEFTYVLRYNYCETLRSAGRSLEAIAAAESLLYDLGQAATTDSNRLLELLNILCEMYAVGGYRAKGAAMLLAPMSSLRLTPVPLVRSRAIT